MRVHAVLLDVDGVLVVSWEPVPGAAEAVRAIRAAGIRVLFLTNTTSRPSAEVAAMLRDRGFVVSDEDLLAAGVATAAYLRAHHAHARCLVLNEGPLDDFAGITLVGGRESPDVVVIGSAGPSFGWEAINRAARAVIGGARLIAMHGTATWLTADGICVDGGSYIAALERATGCVAVTIGKPALPMFEEALRRVGTAADDVAMVGDDVETDVLPAQSLGVHGVLVRTGKYRAAHVVASPQQPECVIDSVADLPPCIGVN